MKIYQIIEYNKGTIDKWFGKEDYYEEVIGTYSSKEKAKIEINKKIQEQKQSEKQYKLCKKCRLEDKLILKKECFRPINKEKIMVISCSGNKFYPCENIKHYCYEILYKIDEYEVIE